jgi:SH3-like domain-containing protein
LRSTAQVVRKADEPRYAVVCVNAAIVREGPSTETNRLGRLTKGDTVVVIEERSDWLLVERRLDEIVLQGWVYRRLLRTIPAETAGPGESDTSL